MAATVIPSVGCPVGCNFCSTSAMFGGKGHSVRFYQTGDELFDIMRQLEANLKVQSFFMMDENFLLDRVRALRLLELMERHDKAWALYLFSSASALGSYSAEQLVRLGLTWVWLGLEGDDSRYAKLHGADTRALVRRLQAHGTRVLGSTIIGLENHTPENIDAAIERAVSHDTVFHQFMLYTPLPGTPLHAELSAQGRMKDESECQLADVHGQSLFNYRHPQIQNGLETELIVRAFQRRLRGQRSERRCAWRGRCWPAGSGTRTIPTPACAAALPGKPGTSPPSTRPSSPRRGSDYRGNPMLRAKMDALLTDLHQEFGLKSRLYAILAGRYVYWKTRREEKRLARGWTYEPPTFYERNAAAQALASGDGPQATLCQPLSSCGVPRPMVAAAVANQPEPLAIG